MVQHNTIAGMTTINFTGNGSMETTVIARDLRARQRHPGKPLCQPSVVSKEVGPDVPVSKPVEDVSLSGASWRRAMASYPAQAASFEPPAAAWASLILSRSISV